jgi:carbamoyltransferase
LYILGISAYYHDSAAALLKDGALVAAAQEERFSRKKHDARFPAAAIRACLASAGAAPHEVRHVVFYDKPLLKFERLLDTYLAFAPRGFRSFRVSFPLWTREKLLLRTGLQRDLERCGIRVGTQELLFSEHHLSHAASAFYPSPFEEAAILTVDGVGEWTTTSLAHGRGSSLDLLLEIHFPHSLGLLYSAFTYYLGFKVNSGEYKVMGLAPYGEPRYADRIRERLIDVRDDGSFRLDLDYFDYCTELRMTNERFDALFGAPPRPSSRPLTQRDMDLAASVQLVTEDAMLKLARTAARQTGSRNLCLAGGVALNCVANGKLLRERIFGDIWVQPAAGDAGGALGAAYAVQHMHLAQPRAVRGDAMRSALLGPRFVQDECRRRLCSVGARLEALDASDVVEWTAARLAEGKIVGWFQGRMEFGPRALGARSILADPRRADMQSYLNLKIKYRESFRPFAPAVLREHVSEWFDLDGDSPYMMIVAPVREDKRIAPPPGHAALEGIERLNQRRSQVPSVTHVDYSARIQTVDERGNPRFHALLERFNHLTGCPILVNTSFNVRGEPIVCTPEDAFRCFMSTGMDVLVVEDNVMVKEAQDPALQTTPDPALLDD